MKGSSNSRESSDQFFDSAEYMSLSEEGFDYGVWVNEPRSVKERRETFLLQMGFSELPGACCPEGERLCESSGAVSRSWDVDSGSAEEHKIPGRESGNDAQPLIDESDEDQESESESPSSLECRRMENRDEEVKIASKRRLSRWWSFLANRRSNSVSDSLDYKEVTKSPVLNKWKVRHNQKRSKELTGLYSAQEIRAHSGTIWAMKFSPDGQLLATGGSDGIVRVWRVGSASAHLSNFPANEGGKVKRDKFGSWRKSSTDSSMLVPDQIFHIEESPVHEFHGHDGDILDLAWSNSNHLLSSSMDKTVRLWSLVSGKCLEIFHHIDFVTCIQFNPVDENYFVSGSIDGKVRVWGVTERRVVDWADVRDVITAICYQPNGKGFVVGSVVTACHFFDASGAHLRLDRIIEIRGRKKTSNRITSIQFENSTRVMITSEDGKIRVIEGSDIVQKYRGLPKSGSQLSASFTSTTEHIVSVGEDSRVYLWNYDTSSPRQPKTKTRKSVRSCEHFLSEAVCVALPWSGTATNRSSLLGINSSRRSLECRSEAISSYSERFSIGNWFSIEGRCLGASATWPEEKLPLWELSDEEEIVDDRTQGSETWGLVIVTASFNGKIRTFHNYGLPARL